jgi:hypothetical protein
VRHKEVGFQVSEQNKTENPRPIEREVLWKIYPIFAAILSR